MVCDQHIACHARDKMRAYLLFMPSMLTLMADDGHRTDVKTCIEIHNVIVHRHSPHTYKQQQKKWTYVSTAYVKCVIWRGVDGVYGETLCNMCISSEKHVCWLCGKNKKLDAKSTRTCAHCRQEQYFIRVYIYIDKNKARSFFHFNNWIDEWIDSDMILGIGIVCGVAAERIACMSVSTVRRCSTYNLIFSDKIHKNMVHANSMNHTWRYKLMNHRTKFDTQRCVQPWALARLKE